MPAADTIASRAGTKSSNHAVAGIGEPGFTFLEVNSTIASLQIH
jgi:hypothetical protein